VHLQRPRLTLVEYLVGSRFFSEAHDIFLQVGIYSRRSVKSGTGRSAKMVASRDVDTATKCDSFSLPNMGKSPDFDIRTFMCSMV
jgi:hypothetical protein